MRVFRGAGNPTKSKGTTTGEDILVKVCQTMVEMLGPSDWSEGWSDYHYRAGAP